MILQTYQQIQVISATLYQFMFLSVDNDGCNLLIHENENGAKQGQHWSQKHVHPPILIIPKSRLYNVCYYKFSKITYLIGTCDTNKMQLSTLTKDWPKYDQER